ncbi:hypothetical protein TL16_g03551 [Triparma laevis f. inornata]|uniref:Uncharacterized protein n=1 Tax=Triparma laevis f. inornata TaxID=1714386 RepID=A0A9W7E1G0_9STRA|nr:hypothetical protein TL16_g03551 [Triparma laevis f. inornata]
MVEFNLSFSRIKCEDVGGLVEWCPKGLECLSLDNNFIGKAGLKLLSSTLLSSLQSLNLSFNSFDTTSFPILFKHLTTSTSLKELTLTGNQMDMVAAKGLAYALSHNCTLTSLSIENCSLAFNPQRHVVAGLCSNRSSGIKHLSGLNLSGVVAALNFPESIMGWGNTEVLRFIKYCWQCERSQPPNTTSTPRHEGYKRHAEYLRNNFPHLKAPASPAEVCQAVATGWKAWNEEGGGSDNTDRAESSEDTMTAETVTAETVTAETVTTDTQTTVSSSSQSLEGGVEERRRSLDEPNPKVR